MDTVTSPRWEVLEYTDHGAALRYTGPDFQGARDLYDSLESAMWAEVHPIATGGQHNIFLGRKFFGVEQGAC